MSDSGGRSPRATVRKIFSLEKKEAEVEIPNELCDLKDLSLDEVHSPRERSARTDLNVNVPSLVLCARRSRSKLTT